MALKSGHGGAWDGQTAPTETNPGQADLQALGLLGVGFAERNMHRHVTGHGSEDPGLAAGHPPAASGTCLQHSMA